MVPGHDRHAALLAAFNRLVDLDPDRRAAALSEIRGEDPGLADEVARLLEADARAGDVFAPLDRPELDSPTNDPLIGACLSHYRIASRIGSGGMGVVYRAWDERLERTVALKFLPGYLWRDPQSTRRFLNEAKAAAALEHKNICAVHELEWTPDGRAYLVMPCYEGELVSRKLERGPLDIGAALEITLQIAEGLAAAHEAGILHRDIKPSNLLVKSNGVVKVLDFGLAKISGSTLTGLGLVAGTAAYMSPEQIRGEEVDGRTDIWSLGAVLYEMLAGQAALGGEPVARTLRRVVDSEPVDVRELRPGIPECVATVVRKCLHKNRDLRYPGMTSLADAVRAAQRFLDKEPPQGAIAEERLSTLHGKAPAESNRLPGRTHASSRREQGSETTGRQRIRGRPALLAGMTVAALAWGGIWMSNRNEVSESPPTEPVTLTVLPLRGYGAGDVPAQLATELTDRLSARLRESEHIQMVPYGMTQTYGDAAGGSSELAWAFEAEFIVDGVVFVFEDRVQISIELLNRRRGISVWSDFVESDGRSLQAEVDRLALAMTAVLDELRARPGAAATGFSAQTKLVYVAEAGVQCAATVERWKLKTVRDGLRAHHRLGTLPAWSSLAVAEPHTLPGALSR